MTAPAWLPSETAGRTTVYPDRLSWLTARTKASQVQKSIGSTGVAAVLGVSSFDTPWGIWSSHYGPEAPSRAVVMGWSDNDWHEMVAAKEAERARNQEDLDRGNFFEGPIREWTSGRYADQWAPIATVSHPEHPWLIVSPDGFARDLDGTPCGQEIKTARYADGWGPDGTVIEQGPRRRGPNSWQHDIPRYYLTQVYAMLACTGLPWWDITVGLAFHDVRTLRVLADEPYQAWMVRTVAAWRQRHLIEMVPPPVDDTQDCGAYQRTIPREGGARPATIEECEMIEAHLKVKAEAKALDREKRRLTNQLRDSMGDCARIYDTDAGLSASIASNGNLTTKEKR